MLDILFTYVWASVFVIGALLVTLFWICLVVVLVDVFATVAKKRKTISLRKAVLDDDEKWLKHLDKIIEQEERKERE